MAPTSTEKGSMRSVAWGTRNSEVCATISGEMLGMSAARRVSST